MSLHRDDWLKIAAGVLLATSGAGLAGVGPLAGMLGGAGAAGAAGAGAAGAAGAGAAGAGSAGLLGAASPTIGTALAMQGLGTAASGAAPKYSMSQFGSTPGQQTQQPMDFHALAGGQSQLPRMQLQNRLPPPQY